MVCECINMFLFVYWIFDQEYLLVFADSKNWMSYEWTHASTLTSASNKKTMVKMLWNLNWIILWYRCVFDDETFHAPVFISSLPDFNAIKLPGGNFKMSKQTEFHSPAINEFILFYGHIYCNWTKPISCVQKYAHRYFLYNLIERNGKWIQLCHNPQSS